jgi:hypothetical protein
LARARLESMDRSEHARKTIQWNNDPQHSLLLDVSICASLDGDLHVSHANDSFPSRSIASQSIVNLSSSFDHIQRAQQSFFLSRSKKGVLLTIQTENRVPIPQFRDMSEFNVREIEWFEFEKTLVET